MDFTTLASYNADPSPTDVGAFLVEYLEKEGPSKRGDMVEAVDVAWQGASGREMNGSLTHKVKKALSVLEAEGIVRPTGAFGIWMLADPDLQPIQRPKSEVAFTDVAVELEESGIDAGSGPELVVGDGRQSVYCFYLDIYRSAAELDGQDRWPMKIGMTTGPVEARMAAHRTALPERPRFALLIRTTNAAILERVIHGVLTIRGHRHDESGGAEWFLTNPDEILELHQAIMGKGSERAVPLGAVMGLSAGTRSP